MQIPCHADTISVPSIFHRSIVLKLYGFCLVFVKKKEKWLDKKGGDYKETEWKMVSWVFPDNSRHPQVLLSGMGSQIETSRMTDWIDRENKRSVGSRCGMNAPPSVIP